MGVASEAMPPVHDLPPSALRLRDALHPPKGPTPPRAERPWTLSQRHAEGGDWWVVEEAMERGLLADWIAGPPVRPDYGDLVRLVDPAGAVRGFWVQGREALRRADPVPDRLGGPSLDWEGAWERPEAEGDDLLKAARGVDRRRLALAACACIEAALAVGLSEDTTPPRVVEAIRAWVRGEASDEVVISAGEAADEEARLSAYASLAAAATAAADAACYPVWDNRGTTPADDAGWAAINAAAAMSAGRSVEGAALARRQLSPLVRRWIPLSIVLLGRAGEPTPLGLGF